MQEAAKASENGKIVARPALCSRVKGSELTPLFTGQGNRIRNPMSDTSLPDLIRGLFPRPGSQELGRKGSGRNAVVRPASQAFTKERSRSRRIETVSFRPVYLNNCNSNPYMINS